MRKLVCLILIALFFQIIGCKDQLENSTLELSQEEDNSLSTEVLDWDEAMEDLFFRNLLEEVGTLESDELTLKGAKKKKKLKLNKSKIKKTKLGSYESYTLLVDSLDFENLSFSNLVLEKKQDISSAFIFKYFPSRKWIAHYINGISMDFDGKVGFRRINMDDYSLKSTLVCEHFTIIAEYQCTAGGDHWPGELCDGSSSQLARVEILFDGEVCYEVEDGAPPQTIAPPAIGDGATGGGGSPSPSDSEPSITTIITPYGPHNIEEITLVNDLFSIELGDPTTIDIEDLTKFDPNSEIVIEGKNVAYDNKGGFYFKHSGYVVYYKSGFCHVDVNGYGYWVEAGTGFNYFINYIGSVLNKPVTDALSVFAMMTPIDGFLTLATGEDIHGVEQSQAIAGIFILAEIIPGTKLLKPISKLLRAPAKKLVGNFASAAKLLDHFIKHADDFGGKFASKEAYEIGAKNFFALQADGTILQYARKGGDIVRYDQIDNIFAICNKDGTILTFFKPDNGVDYFKTQIIKDFPETGEKAFNEMITINLIE